jgi:bifunctional UDP-N-acetylglucosamine pyrophosphorylase/glucosamine-1-phosphate N-acetyltransferase
VVLGYKAEEVKKYIGERARYAMQDKQLGTGHAVATALPHLSPESKTVIVFYADHPLIDVEVIQTLYKAHLSKNSPLTLVTIIPEDFQDWRKCFYDYGRIVRDSHGKIVTNVEMKDASAVELEIREVSPSFFCFDHAWLKENIKKIGTQNAQGEYYLTDLVGLAREQGHELNSCTIPTHKALGVNTPEQLELVLQFMA